MPTQPDKRKTARKLFTPHGHIYGRDGASLGSCRFLDVSRTGARLSVPKPDQFPDDVIVALSRDGSVRRPGRVVWRKDAEIGIRFEAPTKPE